MNDTLQELRSALNELNGIARDRETLERIHAKYTSRVAIPPEAMNKAQRALEIRVGELIGMLHDQGYDATND